MPTIQITGVPPYDGEYEVTFASLNMRAWRTIKRISGIRPAELGDAMRNSDADLVLALAVVGIERTGRIVDEDLLLDADSGKVRLTRWDDEDDDETGDADPPPSSSGGSGSGSSASSGVSTPPASTPETSPSGSGSPPSATAATSDPQTSQT